MKIIFLDIDGVLNCTRTPNPRKFPYIVDQGLLKRFLTLRERTGAEVVLASTWRYEPIGLLAAKHFKIPSSSLPDMPEEPGAPKSPRGLPAITSRASWSLTMKTTSSMSCRCFSHPLAAVSPIRSRAAWPTILMANPIKT